MGSMSSKGSGKGRPGPCEPLGARVERLEAKLAIRGEACCVGSHQRKEHAEKEKSALLELAAERGRAEAVQTLAASEGLHGIRLPTRLRGDNSQIPEWSLDILSLGAVCDYSLGGVHRQSNSWTDQRLEIMLSSFAPCSKRLVREAPLGISCERCALLRMSALPCTDLLHPRCIGC